MNNTPAIGWSGSILQRYFVFLTIVLFALLPFHAFLVTWLGFGLHVPGPLNAWKEIVIVILFGLTLLNWGVREIRGRSVIASPSVYLRINSAKQSRTKEKQASFDILDITILVFFAIGLVSALLQFLEMGNESFVRIFYGFKYDFLMLAAFLLFRHGPFSTTDLASKAAKTILIVGMAIATFAILQATILPRDFLAAFGYTKAFGTWDPNGPLATYQALDANHPLTVRAMGTFAGPNQFAMYCLIVAGLAGGLFIRARESLKKLPWKKVALVVLPVLGIVLSYSRSAFVGLVFAIGTFFAMGQTVTAFLRKRWKVLAMTAIAFFAVSILALPFLTSSSYIRSIFVRPGSSEGHWTRSIEGVKGVLEKPVLGYGMGEAGPASTRIGSGEGWIPENWYLQIGLEYGLIGLISWLTILFLTAKKLYQAAKLPASRFPALPLLFSFIAINVACLFLHAWEDSAVAITWWGLAGLALKKIPLPNTSTMDLQLLRTFQRQVLLQCKFILLAADDLQNYVRQNNMDGVFFALQNLLNAGANVSKALWTAGGRNSSSRKILRESIGVSDDSPLQKVTMRNNFEHFDERLDKWWAESKSHNVIDLNIAPKGSISDKDSLNMFRNFDPKSTDLYFWSQEFNTNELVQEVLRILPKLTEEANKPHWDTSQVANTSPSPQ